jgi:hypothetical protein
MAGIINEKVKGSRLKKFLRSAWLIKKNVEKKNHPVTTRNMEITIYAMGEIK